MKPTDGFDQTLTPDQASALSETAVASESAGPSAAPASPLSLPSYKIGSLLGRGGMGEVVLAEDLEIGRDVAVKRMRSEHPTPEAEARFLREARIQARLDHPAIVPVHALGRDAAGRPYFTMKRLAGTTLLEVLAGGGETLQRLLRAFIDVCLAIEFAHNRGFIHRDLKPANVMLGDYGEVYVLDWGVARQVGETEDNPRRRSPIKDIESLGGETQAGAVLGTPGYMSPEQLRGSDVTPATDVYALGAILFELLTTEPVHPHGQPAVTSTLAGGKHSPIARTPDRSIAPELDKVCTAALAEDPAARPTARAVADRVQRFLDGDRDLEARRTLAAELLTAAQADVASGDPGRRASAMTAAGRALALDPQSDAASLITSLMLSPPTELPPALAQRLEETDVEQITVQGKLATFALLSYFSVVPILLWMGVRDWSLFFVLLVLISAAVGSAVVLRRLHGVHIWIPLVLNAVILMLITRLTSPFVILPGIIAGSAASFAAFPRLMHRPVLVIGAYIGALVVPLILEATGVWASTWKIEGGSYIGQPTAVMFDGLSAQVFLIAGSIGIMIVLPLFVRSLAISQRAGRRQIEIQAWHLHQLIPDRR